jgi:hypothetical protein
MVIENRDAVVAGTKLIASYKKQAYLCTVEGGEDGKLAFIYDGKSYSSPSSAGTAITGTACIGWRFWSLADGTVAPAKALRKGKTKAQPAAMPKTARRRREEEKAKPTILHRHNNQEDLEPGQVRWVCNACMKIFSVGGDGTPDACPEGHRNDDAELNRTATMDGGE